MALLPGTRIGPYEVTGLLGTGGMGEVYRARDTRLGRDIALKVLPPSLSADPERLARFEREARTLASLNHPRIAQIYGLEDAPPGAGFHTALVMELVEGEDLSLTIARGALPVDDALAIARQVAEALEAAHEAGVVHRDLKPANIKVKPDGSVKVLDFGLAKALEPATTASGSASVMTSPAMTQAGIVLGTAAYMAPEQARGRAVDKRADIWAFGVVLFEMLTGRPLFAGDTVSDTIAAVLTREVDVAALPPGAPPQVRSLLLRCLERDPRRRLRDIGDALIELERPATSGAGTSSAGVIPAAASGPMPVQSTSRAARATTWLAVTLGVALVVALGFLWRARRPLPAAPIIQYEVSPAGDSRLSLSSRPSIALSADGSTLAFAATSGGVSHLYLRKRGEVDVREIPRTQGASDPAFSPDGRWIAFVTPAELRKVSIDGAALVSLAPVTDPRGLAWVDDQTIVVSLRTGSGLSLVPSGGGTPREITKVDRTRGERSHRWPAAVPGGKAVLFTIGSAESPDDYNDSAIDAVILDTGARRKVLDAAAFVRCTGDGRLLFMRSGVLYAVAFDPARLATTGEPTAVLPGVDGDPTTGAGHFSISTDQTLAYVPGLGATGQRRLTWADRAGVLTPIDVPPAVFNDPAISPDGRRLAVCVGASGRADIWTYDLGRQLFSRLTFDGGAATPYWGRDSQIVYYTRIEARAERSTLRRKHVDGSGDAVVIATIPGRVYLGYVDPAERFAIVTVVPSDRPQDNDVFRIPLNPAGPPVAILSTPALEYAPTVSPNGRYLAYVSTASGQQEVYVHELDGAGQWQISRSGGVGPRWSADGRELFFRNDSIQMVMSVETTGRFEPGTARVLFDGAFNWRTEAGMNYTVHPVTGQFLMIQPPSAAGADRPAVRVIVNWQAGTGG